MKYTPKFKFWIKAQRYKNDMIDEITIIGVSSILTLNMRVNKIHNPAILINTINCIMIFIPRLTIQNPGQVGSQSE